MSIDQIPKENKEEIKPLTFLQKFKYLFIKPSKTFKNIERVPDNKIPIINISLYIIFTSLIFPAVLSHVQFIDGSAITEAFNTFILILFTNVVLINTLLILTVLAVITVIIWLIARRFLINKNYTDMLKGVAYSFIPLAVGKLVILILVMISLPSYTVTPTMTVPEVNSVVDAIFNSQVWIYAKIIDGIMWYWSGTILAYAISEFNHTSLKVGAAISYSLITIYILLVVV